MTQCSIAGHLLLSTREGPADKMWALGGEFIRDLHSDSSLRKEASGVGSSPDDRVRRAPPLSRRRRSAEILRFHLPQVPPVPYQDGSLTLAVTHKFPRGGQLKRYYPVVALPSLMVFSYTSSISRCHNCAGEPFFHGRCVRP